MARCLQPRRLSSRLMRELPWPKSCRIRSPCGPCVSRFPVARRPPQGRRTVRDACSTPRRQRPRAGSAERDRTPERTERPERPSRPSATKPAGRRTQPADRDTRAMREAFRPTGRAESDKPAASPARGRPRMANRPIPSRRSRATTAVAPDVTVQSAEEFAILAEAARRGARRRRGADERGRDDRRKSRRKQRRIQRRSRRCRGPSRDRRCSGACCDAGPDHPPVDALPVPTAEDTDVTPIDLKPPRRHCPPICRRQRTRPRHRANPQRPTPRRPRPPIRRKPNPSQRRRKRRKSPPHRLQRPRSKHRPQSRPRRRSTSRGNRQDQQAPKASSLPASGRRPTIRRRARRPPRRRNPGRSADQAGNAACACDRAPRRRAAGATEARNDAASAPATPAPVTISAVGNNAPVVPFHLAAQPILPTVSPLIRVAGRSRRRQCGADRRPRGRDRGARAGRTKRFEIRLDPPELGRIDVRLDVDQPARSRRACVVERAETLDLLRRDAPQLERALQHAGLNTEGGLAILAARPELRQSRPAA